jgi:hypothetical protein
MRKVSFAGKYGIHKPDIDTKADRGFVTLFIYGLTTLSIINPDCIASDVKLTTAEEWQDAILVRIKTESRNSPARD